MSLPTLSGTLSPDRWHPSDSHGAGIEPWPSFERALLLLQRGDVTDASREWRRIAALEGIDSLHVLQAWHFLRGVGIQPPPGVATVVYAAIAEVAVPGGHDVLAGYRDGSVRYLNHGGLNQGGLNHGGTVVVSHGTEPTEAVRSWLRIAGDLARVVGVWEQPDLPPLPPGATRITMLTPAGARFGQGADGALRQDPAAGGFLAAATRVLTELVALDTAAPM